jgi:hypothetical protein
VVDSPVPYSVVGRTSADVAAAAAKDKKSVMQFGLIVSPFDSYILFFILITAYKEPLQAQFQASAQILHTVLLPVALKRDIRHDDEKVMAYDDVEQQAAYAKEDGMFLLTFLMFIKLNLWI